MIRTIIFWNPPSGFRKARTLHSEKQNDYERKNNETFFPDEKQDKIQEKTKSDKETKKQRKSEKSFFLMQNRKRKIFLMQNEHKNNSIWPPPNVIPHLM